MGWRKFVPGRGEEAAAQLIGLLVASVVFTVSFASVVQVSLQQKETLQEPEEAHHNALAASIADLLLGTAGIGWYQGDACLPDSMELNDAAFDPENVTRIGLAEEACATRAGRATGSMNLSFDKIENLYAAQYDADGSDGAVDYEEARASLDLVDAGVDFHLRSWPILPAVEQLLGEGYRDPNLRPLYVGDYEELHGSEQSAYLVEHTAGVTDGSTAATLWVDITNNGTVATAFSVTFEVATKHEIISEKHTVALDPAESHNVTFVVNKTSDWTWKDADEQFEYSIRDPSKSVGEGTVSMEAITMTYGSARKIHTVESAQLEWELVGGTVDVDVVYDNLDGEGGSNGQYTGWTLEIRDAADALVASTSTLDKKGGTATFTLTAAGDHRAVLNGGTTWTAQSDWFNVAAEGMQVGRFTPDAGAGEWVPQSSVGVEAAFIGAIVEQFDESVMGVEFDHPDVPYVAGGDVYPDDNRLLADELPNLFYDADGSATLANYNVLVVGTGVDHNTLTSGNVKYPIRDFVLAGGSLIVFGSANQAVQWLQPLFHVALDSASGGISVPDEEHPILHTPNDLESDTFDNHGTVWQFNSDDQRSHFTHVVLAGEDDILAVSDPGTFGAGRIVLTSWQPYDMTYGDPGTECDPATLTFACDGLQFVHNTITIAYRGLYLDYGPLIPDDVRQGSQLRAGAVYHPQIGDMVEVNFVVYVFG